MKKINDYVRDKTGLTIEAQVFSEKMKKHFNYESCKMTKSSILFNNVKMNEDVKFSGTSKSLLKNDVYESLEFKNNGWILVTESADKSYSIMASKSLKEDFNMPNIIDFTAPVQNVSGTERFPVVTAVQLEALTSIHDVLQKVRKLSIEDVNRLRNLMGPSPEERILTFIIDTAVTDMPSMNGQQNGV